MSKWIVVAAFLCAGAVAGCGGGGSGVSSSKRLVSLSAGEQTDLCEYLVDVTGPDRTVNCGGGVTITLESDTVAECLADLRLTASGAPNCTATVGNAEECTEALAAFTDADICADKPFPATCAVWFSAECIPAGS